MNLPVSSFVSLSAMLTAKSLDLNYLSSSLSELVGVRSKLLKTPLLGTVQNLNLEVKNKRKKSVDLVVARDGFLCITEIVHVFLSGYFVAF